MPKTVSRPSVAVDTSATNNDPSSCGLPEHLSSGIGLIDPTGLMSRKRSLDNLENIPPFVGLDHSAPATGVVDKPTTLPLLDLAAQKMSQHQRKHRRTVITASSPGGHQRVVSNPRLVASSISSSFLRSLPAPPRSRPPPPPLPPQTQPPSQPQPQLQKNSINSSVESKKPSTSHLPPIPQLPPSTNNRSTTSTSTTASWPVANPSLRRSMSGTSVGVTAVSGASGNSGKLRRMPKRNLKPLDFSGLHSSSLSLHSAPSKPGATVSTGGILPLPVSPAQSSPTCDEGNGGTATASSPAIVLHKGLIKSSTAIDLYCGSSVHPTPPNTGPRLQTAFSGLLASAYQRASTKRSSKRALCFDNVAHASSNSFGEDLEKLLKCDPVMGPQCPIIGDPTGIFEQQRNGIDSLQRTQDKRSQTKFSAMTRSVHRAQADFEAAVSGKQPTKHRGPGRPSKHRGKGGKGKGGKGETLSSAGKRAISECKYCGKQYKYHSKLASHEQHCSSRLEALLYSADENEQHIIHCVCGPRHDHPVGERDDLPMVQCDNCFMWLHIDCVDLDQDNLPDEYFCPRCEDTPSYSYGGGMFTPKRNNKLSRHSSNLMSPESSKLATLLAGVPNDESDTDDEPMLLRVQDKTRRSVGGPGDDDVEELQCMRRRRNLNIAYVTKVNSGGHSEDDTMSISDASEVARFHRQGGSATKCKSPMMPRLAQSEADASPVQNLAHRRRVRAGVDSKHQTVFTDALSSDFLGLPLPETIFSQKPSFVSGDLGESAAPDMSSLCASQQPSMEDLTQFLATSQPQWSLTQLPNMLDPNGGTGNHHHHQNHNGGGSRNSSAYLDQALADLGLGGADGEAVSAMHGVSHAPTFDTNGAPLSELVDLPIDNEFSALLESFASGGHTISDAGVYSSIGENVGGVLNDDAIMEMSHNSLPISGPMGLSSCGGNGIAISAGSVNGSRLVGGRRLGKFKARGGRGSVAGFDFGSSSTITLMHDDNSLCSQDNIESPTSAAMHQKLPPPARPPPGMPGVMRNTGRPTPRHNHSSLRSKSRSTGRKGKAVLKGGRMSFSDQPQVSGPSAVAATSKQAAAASIALNLPSNPPSMTGLEGVDVSQLLGDIGSSQILDWQPTDGEALDRELEGLINFDA